MCKNLRNSTVLILLSLVLLPATIQGQSLIDSLKQVLPGAEGIEKVAVLNQLSWELKSSETTEAIAYGKQGLDLSNFIAYKSGLAEASYNLTVLYYIQQDFAKSNEYANQAIGHYQGLEEIAGIAKSWNIMGLSALSLGHNEQALAYFQKALQQFKIIKNEENILKIEANIGNVYYRMGDFLPALEAYFRIVAYARKTGDEDLLVTNLQNVGFAYSELGNYARSLENSFEVLKVLRAQNDSSRLPNTLQSIASTFNRLEMYKESIVSVNEAILIDKRLNRERSLGSHYITLANALKGEGLIDSALYYNKKALATYEKIGYKSIGTVLNNLGNIYALKGELEQAESHYNRALEISSERKRAAVVALSQYNLGRLYLELNELEKARLSLLVAYKYWSESNKYKELSSVTKELSSLYSQLNQPDSALNYEHVHDMAEDSVFGRQKQNEVMRLMVMQSLEEQKSGLINLQDTEENSLSEHVKIAVAGSALMILVGLLVHFIYKKQSTIQKLQGDLDQKGRELAFLSLTAMQRENFIREFTDKLNSLAEQYSDNQELRTLIRNLKMERIHDDHWDHFRTAFEQIAPHFFDHLLSTYSNLTETDLRFCALIRLAVPTREIARITGISTASVNKARYRLRKRMGIGSEESLDRFILTI